MTSDVEEWKVRFQSRAFKGFESLILKTMGSHCRDLSWGRPWRIWTAHWEASYC